MDLWTIAKKTIKGTPFKVSYLGEGDSRSIMDCLLSLQAALPLFLTTILQSAIIIGLEGYL